MLKSLITLFFITILLGVTAAPTIVSVIDCNAEASLFLDAEEEEKEGKEGKESSKDKEVKLFQDLFPLYNMLSEQLALAEAYYSKSYSSNDKELVSPPPEQNVV
ncbi:hypothetical protein [Winogradskyella sp. 3972H.M.0a.05]|uniref:hypothetical protein n=1 Tax=Winogradskyella sp. 3972H.M.0a.05 TaxID=2950277 RepID=UPI0033942D51